MATASLPSLAMGRLVAICLPGGSEFVDAVRRIWDADDAVLPLDPNAPDAYNRRLLERLGAAEVWTPAERSGLPDGRATESSDRLVIATSGTTREPRGVILTESAVEAAASASATGLGPHSGPHWLACLPLHHIGGFGVVARCIVTDTPVTVHDGFDARDVVEAARNGCTHTSLVPTAPRQDRPDPLRHHPVGRLGHPRRPPGQHRCDLRNDRVVRRRRL